MVQQQILKTGQLLIYTRNPKEDYSSYLAHSAHFAYSRDGVTYQPLNQNYGILFASATVNQPDTLHEKGLKCPFLFRTRDGGFGVVAVRVNPDGSNDPESRGKILLWTSKDLVHFEEKGLLYLGTGEYVSHAACCYDPSSRGYVICWQDENDGYYRNTVLELDGTSMVSAAFPGEPFSYAADVTGPEGAVNGNVVEVNASFGEELLLKWSPLQNTEIRVPEEVTVSSWEELKAVRATSFYNDGSTLQKEVRWESDKVDFERSGSYEVSGTVVQPEYPFPLAKGYADPDILYWNGKYYFLATNDNMNYIGLYVREADSLEGLFSPDVKHFNAGGRDYLVWSYRKWTGKPEDSGSMLYIAQTDPHTPWKLISEPVLITRPVYGWENNHHTINNEGPYAFVAGGTVYLTYSGGAAGGYSYAVGLLTANENADLLDPRVWVKSNAPVLSYYSADEFGPGHNAFFTDEFGNFMITFHAEEAFIRDGGLRCSGMRRVHFDIHGTPRFDMSAVRDLAPNLRKVTMKVNVLPKEGKKE